MPIYFIVSRQALRLQPLSTRYFEASTSKPRRRRQEAGEAALFHAGARRRLTRSRFIYRFIYTTFILVRDITQLIFL